MFDKEDVKHRAKGTWPDILSSLTSNQDLIAAIDRGTRRSGPCPMCGGTDRFRFTDKFADGNYICSPNGNGCGTGDGFGLLMELNGWSFPETVDAVGKWIGLPENQAKAHRSRRVHADKVRKKQICYQYTKDKMNSAWQQALSCSDAKATPLRRYLVRRGLRDFVIDTPHLRFHPALEYWHADKESEKPQLLGKFPALLAKVLDGEGNPVTLHRTFLTREGDKAPVPKPKKVWSAHSSCVTVRLHQVDDVVCLAEGIETAMAVHLVTGLPTWACLNSGSLASIVLPDTVTKVNIFSDLDRPVKNQDFGAGLKASLKACHQLSERSVCTTIHVPPGPIPEDAKGVDWLDIWNNHVSGHDGFRAVIDWKNQLGQYHSHTLEGR